MPSEATRRLARRLGLRSGDESQAMADAISDAVHVGAQRLPGDPQEDEAFTVAKQWCEEHGLDPTFTVGHLDAHERRVVLASVGRHEDGQPVSAGELTYAAAAAVRQDRRAIAEGWHELSPPGQSGNGLPGRPDRFTAISTRGLMRDNDFVAWDLRTNPQPDHDHSYGSRRPANGGSRISANDLMNLGIREAAWHARKQTHAVEVTVEGNGAHTHTT
jgi:hypothetical protein